MMIYRDYIVKTLKTRYRMQVPSDVDMNDPAQAITFIRNHYPDINDVVSITTDTNNPPERTYIAFGVRKKTDERVNYIVRGFDPRSYKSRAELHSLVQNKMDKDHPELEFIVQYVDDAIEVDKYENTSVGNVVTLTNKQIQGIRDNVHRDVEEYTLRSAPDGSIAIEFRAFGKAWRVKL